MSARSNAASVQTGEIRNAADADVRPSATALNTKHAAVVVACLAVALGAAWFLLSSTLPDGLEHAAELLGFAHRAGNASHAPMAGYQAPWFHSPAARKAAAGVLGVALCFLAALLIGRLSSKRSPATPPRTG